jgi:hypothetical protein
MKPSDDLVIPEFVSLVACPRLVFESSDELLLLLLLDPPNPKNEVSPLSIFVSPAGAEDDDDEFE